MTSPTSPTSSKRRLRVDAVRLTILGGSVAGPNPGAGCSGVLCIEGSTNLVLDLGPGTLAELLKHVRPEAIDGIMLSHMHQDHWLDLIPLRYRLKYSPGDRIAKIPVLLPPGGRSVLDAIGSVLDEENDPDRFFGDVFELKEYDPNLGIVVGDLAVTFTRSRHPVPCWMMRVAGVAGDVGYTADTGVTSDASTFFSGVRCLLVEATSLEPEPAGTHLTARESGELAAECGADSVILCHLWAENDPTQILDAARIAYRGPVQLARPGLVVEWS